MKPTPTASTPRRKLAAFRLPFATLARLRDMAARARLSQSKILEALIHSSTL
jgi:hypothetical protein